jgi:predicted nicotinamide N-methyase
MPRSADALLDSMVAGDELPFWAAVWDAAFGLCSRIASVPTPGRMLELGCGVGTVGCFAAALGWDVTLTDYLPAALRYASRNLKANDLTGRLVRTDWRQFALAGRWDLVVGSDILYDPDVHPALCQTLAGLREAGASIVLADPGRSSALKFAADREVAGWPIRLEMATGREGPVALYLVDSPDGARV